MIPQKRKNPSRIAFGSCNEQNRQNNLWQRIESRHPAAFVWGGDAIYADFKHPSEYMTHPPKPKYECATPARVRKLYKDQLAVPGYESLRKSNVTIFGTIDDHDFGCDNSDKNYEHKYETTNAFIDFIGEPNDSPMSRRASAGHGVYGVKLFDFGRPEGHYLVPEWQACIDPDVIDCTPMYTNKTVAVFVLDVRTNKDPWQKGNQAYFHKDNMGDFLGESQWTWFEEAIANSKAAVNVVVNGLQVNSKIFPNPNIAENWGSFPSAQQRLFDTVLGSSVSAPILISGDVHMTQIMRKDCRKKNDHFQRRPIMEFTTSGMTHSWGRIHTPYIEGERFSFQEHFHAWFNWFLMQTMHRMLPWNSLLMSSKERPEITHDGGIEGAKQGLQYSLERNFGELEFDWDERTVTMRSIGEGAKASPLLAARVSMDQLSGRWPMSTSKPKHEDFQKAAANQHPMVKGEWVCLEYRGQVSMVREMMSYAIFSVYIASMCSLPILLPAYFLVRLWRRRRRRFVDLKSVSSTPLLQKQISF